jgi:hypothetical protein
MRLHSPAASFTQKYSRGMEYLPDPNWVSAKDPVTCSGSECARL